jgi:hypothetical protein
MNRIIPLIRFIQNILFLIFKDMPVLEYSEAR